MPLHPDNLLTAWAEWADKNRLANVGLAVLAAFLIGVGMGG